MSNETTTAFSVLYEKEILASNITLKSPVDLVIALVSISLCFGIDRVELAIENTYCKNEAAQIRAMVNTALQLTR